MGLGRKKENWDDYNGKSSGNMKLIYVLIGLTVVTVALVVLLVLFMNGTLGGEATPTVTPSQSTATPGSSTATPQPTATPEVINGEMIQITDPITVPQVPAGSAPSFAMGTGSNLGSVIIDNTIVHKGDLLLPSNGMPEGFSPSKIVNVYNESRLNMNYPINVSTTTVSMEKRALSALASMLEKAKESGNEKYFVNAGYDAAAEDLDYRTGLGFDMGFNRLEGQEGKFSELPQGQWLIQNCYQYGFVQRYTADKSSITGMTGDSTHYRYVGFPHSVLMQQKDFSLEEYVSYVRSTGYIQVKNGDKTTHEIMYFYANPDAADGKTVCKISDAAFEAYSQGTAKITVSGDNFGGFIVTVIYN